MNFCFRLSYDLHELCHFMTRTQNFQLNSHMYMNIKANIEP